MTCTEGSNAFMREGNSRHRVEFQVYCFAPYIGFLSGMPYCRLHLSGVRLQLHPLWYVSGFESEKNKFVKRNKTSYRTFLHQIALSMPFFCNLQRDTQFFRYLSLSWSFFDGRSSKFSHRTVWWHVWNSVIRSMMKQIVRTCLLKIQLTALMSHDSSCTAVFQLLHSMISSCNSHVMSTVQIK